MGGKQVKSWTTRSCICRGVRLMVMRLGTTLRREVHAYPPHNSYVINVRLVDTCDQELSI